MRAGELGVRRAVAGGALAARRVPWRSGRGTCPCRGVLGLVAKVWFAGIAELPVGFEGGGVADLPVVLDRRAGVTALAVRFIEPSPARRRHPPRSCSRGNSGTASPCCRQAQRRCPSRPRRQRVVDPGMTTVAGRAVAAAVERQAVASDRWRERGMRARTESAAECRRARVPGSAFEA